MNKSQREAVQQAIVFEEDWLYRANAERQAGNEFIKDQRIAAHEKRLAELKEEM